MVKTQSSLDYLFQSDSGNSRLIGRDHKSLLRSVGHRFRDGRWTRQDDPFHVFRGLENPGVGELRSFLGTSYYRRFLVGDFSDTGLLPYDWRPALSRSDTVEDITQEYRNDLPDLSEPAYEDFVLELNARGTNFIRRFRPGNPAGSLGQFLGELHDLPRIPIFLRSRAKHFRDLGSEYLNVEFGWTPFVKDLIKLYQTQQEMRKRLDLLIFNNGLKVRRRSKHEEETVSDIVAEVPLNRPFGLLTDIAVSPILDLSGLRLYGPVPFGYFDPFMTGGGTLVLSRKVTVVSWYTGTFQYYVQDIGSDRWTEKAKAVLFGNVVPNPSVLYQLYPWSWLVDWFTNVGDIVSNLVSNAVDNEVLTDSYVMQTRLDRIDIEANIHWDSYVNVDSPDNLRFSVSAGSDVVHYSRLERNKLRQQATPFGFGLKESEFSLRQLAILAALLISRSPKLKV